MSKFQENFSIAINNEQEFNAAHRVLLALGFKPLHYDNENVYRAGTDTIRYSPSNGYIWRSSMTSDNHFDDLGKLCAWITEERPTKRQLRILELKAELVKLEAEEAAQ